jgi:hypothetical protein
MKKNPFSTRKLFLHFKLQHAVTYCGIILSSLIFIPSSFLYAQCTPYTNAVAGITLSPCPNGTENRSGVAYNPYYNIYYSVDAGNPGYPIQTYSSSGTLIDDRAEGFDYRGLWWNPNTDQLEGNGYDGLGGSKQKLDESNGYPLGLVATYVGHFQPDDQSCGAYDYKENVVFYFFSGTIYVYSRINGTLIKQHSLHNIPVPLSNINSTSVIYTGCTGMEIGIYDYVLKRVYLFSAPGGNYVTSIQLPADAPAHDRFAMAYANNLFWLFDNDSWYSYKLFSDADAVTAKSNTTINTGKDVLSEARNYSKAKPSNINTTIITSSNHKLVNSVNTSNISITPNPAKDYLQLHVQSAGNNKATIQIAGISGNMLIEKTVMLKQGYNDILISVNSLQQGVYTMKVITPNNLEAIKFIKE